MNRYYKNLDTKKDKYIAILLIVILLIIAFGSFLYSIKYIVVTVDGTEYNIETRSTLIDNAVDNVYQQLDLNEDEVLLNVNSDMLVNNETVIDIYTEKNINLKVNDSEFDVKTYVTNTDDLLKELYTNDLLKDVLDEDAKYIFDTETDQVKDDMSLRLIKEETKTVEEQENMGQDVVEIPDDSMYEGTKKVKSEGQNQIDTVTYEIIYHDGKEIDRKEIDRTTTTESIPKEVYVGTKEISPDDMAVWDALAQCEAGGNWSANTGNGYYGGLQINPGSWSSIAPTLGITAALPSDATKEEQIAVGQVMQANSGWGQWPHCSSNLGL